MTSYTIPERESPFHFYATEFIGDVETIEELYNTEAEVGACAYVVENGFCFIQARKGDWKQLRSGRGRNGHRGERGVPGQPGANGRDGRDGVDGKQGPQGPRGERGQKGEQGPRGADGRDGLDGRPGEDGKDGRDGKDGKDGKDGVDGAPGPTGPRGFTGTNGQDGLGWTGGEYDYVTGKVTFHSDDGLSFSTGDLRGSPSPWAHMSIEQLANALRPYL